MQNTNVNRHSSAITILNLMRYKVVAISCPHCGEVHLELEEGFTLLNPTSNKIYTHEEFEKMESEKQFPFLIKCGKNEYMSTFLAIDLSGKVCMYCYLLTKQHERISVVSSRLKSDESFVYNEYNGLLEYPNFLNSWECRNKENSFSIVLDTKKDK